MAGRPFCPRFFPKKAECLGEDCAWYIGIMGKNPNTGEEGLKHGCAVAWEPTLMIEQSRTNRGISGALESFRNEIVKAISGVIMLGQLKAKMLNAKEQGKLEEKIDQLEKGSESITIDSDPVEKIEDAEVTE